jgi:hypothetical protein
MFISPSIAGAVHAPHFDSGHWKGEENKSKHFSTLCGEVEKKGPCVVGEDLGRAGVIAVWRRVE